MSLKNLPSAIIPVLLCATTTFSVSALAQDTTVAAITSGDICAPRDVGLANTLIQNLRGSIVNISATEEVAVSCPLLIYDINIPDGESNNGVVQAALTNSAEIDQFVSCSLLEIDRETESVTTRISSSIIPAGSTNVVLLGFTRAQGTRMNLTCTLPPSSSLGLIAVENS